MDAAYYALTIVAIFVILFWYIQNERISPNDAAVGLLATKKVLELDKEKARRMKARKFSLNRPGSRVDDLKDGDG